MTRVRRLAKVRKGSGCPCISHILSSTTLICFTASLPREPGIPRWLTRKLSRQRRHPYKQAGIVSFSWHWHSRSITKYLLYALSSESYTEYMWSSQIHHHQLHNNKLLFSSLNSNLLFQAESFLCTYYLIVSEVLRSFASYPAVWCNMPPPHDASKHVQW